VRSDLGYLVLGREHGIALLKDRRLSFPAVELLELQGLTDGAIYERTTKGLMAQSGPAHARLRRLVSAAFTPRQVERLRPRLRGYLTGLWRDIAPAGHCEVVTALARPLPSMAIAELLGVPGSQATISCPRSCITSRMVTG
jgi:cytochrome P450